MISNANKNFFRGQLHPKVCSGASSCQRADNTSHCPNVECVMASTFAKALCHFEQQTAQRHVGQCPFPLPRRRRGRDQGGSMPAGERDHSHGYADVRHSAPPAPDLSRWSGCSGINEPTTPPKDPPATHEPGSCLSERDFADIRAGACGHFGTESRPVALRFPAPSSAIPVPRAKATRSSSRSPRPPTSEYVVTKKLGARVRADAPQDSRRLRHHL